MVMKLTEIFARQIRLLGLLWLICLSRALAATTEVTKLQLISLLNGSQYLAPATLHLKAYTLTLSLEQNMTRVIKIN